MIKKSGQRNSAGLQAAAECEPALQNSSRRKTPPHSLFPIVGIGASAGGFEAITQLLEHLPADTGMAFVVVQHLDPTHESALSELLSRATKMPAAQARNNSIVEPNRIYVIPPNKLMKLQARRLKISPRKDGKVDRMPVDYFLRSLAEDENERAIGVIMSGNGSDGTLGLLAVKSAGGITFAQAEKSAKFPSMPASAIAAGCVDCVLTPEKMADELKHMGRRLMDLPLSQPEVEPDQASHEKAYGDILAFLRQKMAVDFTHYKHATLRRRIERRMRLHKLESLKEYRDYLAKNAGEVKELFNDILIHVTGFFRDGFVFQTLKNRILPRLLRGLSQEQTIRVWVPGCSTGEEVYSLAIVLMELMDGKKWHRTVQIFGTDIDDTALEKARAGIYSGNIQSEISPARLRRFFTRLDGGFRVNKNLREMC
ncbi:MAG TPA: chemotaxis protein CheB, partial [Candidatus Acidoferrales bacterium]|nr:chemotaxis protein CheB [Candidatus Acidoferrales bacterium]